MTGSVPKYYKLKDELLEFIKKDKNGRIPSERELCRLYKMSRTTVRKAIKSLVEDGIIESQHGMGNFVNHEKKTRICSDRADTVVGIIIFDGSSNFNFNVYGATLTETVASSLLAAGARAQFLSLESILSGEVKKKNISGIIWISASQKQLENIRWLKQNNIPILSVNYKFKYEKVHCVKTDDEAGGFIAGERLAELGHKDILVVATDKRRPFIDERYAGFKKALEKHGIRHSQSLIFKQMDVEDVYYKMRERVSRNFDFSAVFVIDGIYLSSAVNAIRDEGIMIPEDISLISYDRHYPRIYHRAEIVEIHQQLEKMGTLAVEKMLDVIEGRQKGPVEIVLTPEITGGNSCRRL